MSMLSCRAGLLALKTGRPVLLSNSREDSLLESYKRHPYFLNYKIGVKRDGCIQAMEIELVADGGAYASKTQFVNCPVSFIAPINSRDFSRRPRSPADGRPSWGRSP